MGTTAKQRQKYIKHLSHAELDSLDPNSRKILEWSCELCGTGFKRRLNHVTNSSSEKICCRPCAVKIGHLKANKQRHGTLMDLPNTASQMFAKDLNKFGIDKYPLRSTKKAWFRCLYGHEFERIIGNFATNSACPLCSRQTSKIEIRIFSELLLHFPNLQWQFKIDGREFDIYCPDNKFAIEIDGEVWHRSKAKLDTTKNKVAEKNGITLVRFRFKGLAKLGISYIAESDKESDYETEFQNFCNFLLKQPVPNALIQFSAKWLVESSFQANEQYVELFSRLPGPPDHQSLKFKYPELSSEWSEQNLPLTPDKIWPNSDTPHYWECRKSDQHPPYLLAPGKRLRGDGCPYCSGRKLAPDNSLRALKPIIAERWNFERNYPLRPEDVLAGSTKTFWFQCEHGHEWQDRLYDIKNSEKSRPCKQCRSVGFLFPELAKEWMEEKNGISSMLVHTGSQKNYWWKCSICQNEFQQFPNSRTRHGHGCPNHKFEKIWKTRKKNMKVEDTLGSVFPEIANHWDHDKNPGTPFEVTKQSGQKRYFRCDCGRSEEIIISSFVKNWLRNKGFQCKTCKSKFPNEESFAHVFPIRSNLWDYKLNLDTPQEVKAGQYTQRFFFCTCGKSVNRWISAIKKDGYFRCRCNTNSG
ncbi:MAG: zinc-ribbon domain-containing protein [Deltaproteobacteria bacterium]